MNDYMEKTIEQIRDKDSKDPRWPIEHYLAVAKVCRCNSCYCCAVKRWAGDKVKKTYQGQS